MAISRHDEPRQSNQTRLRDIAFGPITLHDELVLQLKFPYEKAMGIGVWLFMACLPYIYNPFKYPM